MASQQQCYGFAVRRFLVRHRPDYSVLIGLLCGERQVLGHLHTGDIGCYDLEDASELRIAVRLRIERIHLTDAALQEEVDDGNVFLRLGLQCVGPGKITPWEYRANL